MNRTNAWHNMIITILISVRIGTYKLCCDEKDIRVMLKYNVPFFACFFSHCTFTLQFYSEMIIFRASNFIKSRWWILVCYLRRVSKFCGNFSLLNPACFHQFTSLGGLIECTNVNTWNKDRFWERFKWLQNWQLTHRPGHTTPKMFHERYTVYSVRNAGNDTGETKMAADYLNLIWTSIRPLIFVLHGKNKSFESIETGYGKGWVSSLSWFSEVIPFV